MKYRKKPVVIEAQKIDFTLAGIGTQDDDDYYGLGIYKDSTSSTGYSINTLEGKHEVTDGDWIITGVKGEKYPCKPDIFELTYEKV